MRVMLDLKSESGSTSSTRACCPQFPVMSAKRMSARGIKKTKMVAEVLTYLNKMYKNLTTTGLERHHRLASAQEVAWQIEPDQEVESANVLQKVIDVVALVPDCGREIVRTVAFHVMMLDVVEVVRVPRMSHQWIQDVWEQLVDDSVLLVEHSTGVNVLMLQKRICSSIPTLHDAMKDGVPPVEVVEQVNGRW
jgi:hypothetical protein